MEENDLKQRLRRIFQRNRWNKRRSKQQATGSDQKKTNSKTAQECLTCATAVSKLVEWHEGNNSSSNETPRGMEMPGNDAQEHTLVPSLFINTIRYTKAHCDFCNFMWTVVGAYRPNLLEANSYVYLKFTGYSWEPARGSRRKSQGSEDEKTEVDKCSSTDKELRRIRISFYNRNGGFDLCMLQCLSTYNGTELTCKQHPCIGRALGLEVECSLIKNWLSICDKSHNCSVGKERESDRSLDAGFRVIDLIEECVVPMPRKCAYAALSYVWGNTTQLCLTESTMKYLTSPRGLEKRRSGLTRSIRDATIISRDLGFRYLWVDALCIRQDDRQELKRQCQSMDMIFQDASLTLVSAVGADSNAGLPGTRGNPRSATQISTSIGSSSSSSSGSVRLSVVMDELHQKLARSVWDTRAWTFQEKILSRRLLVFTEQQVHWVCNQERWCEDTGWELVNGGNGYHRSGLWFRSSDLRLGAAKDGFPPFEIYRENLEEYSRRSLTYQEDAIMAFSGVLRYLKWSGEEDTGHVWGLPRAHFAASLMWFVSGLHGPGMRCHHFPSWSWAGWKAPKRLDKEPSCPTFVPEFYVLDGNGNDIIFGEPHISQSAFWKAFDPSHSALHGPLRDVKRSASGQLSFWTSICPLRAVGQGNELKHGHDLFLVSSTTEQTKLLAFLGLDWGNEGFYLVAVIVENLPMHRRKEAWVAPILTHYSADGTFQRIPEDLAPVKMEYWMDCSPEWKLVTLA